MLWHLIHKSSKGTTSSGQQCRCDEILTIITMLLLMVIDHHYINKSLCLTIIIVAVIIVIIDVAVIAVINAVADVVVGVAKSVPSLQWWPQFPFAFYSSRPLNFWFCFDSDRKIPHSITTNKNGARLYDHIYIYMRYLLFKKNYKRTLANPLN